jgi:hypothetical protein
MFILFHIFTPLIIFDHPKIIDRFSVNRLCLILGSLLPDLIDKPLNLLGIFNGRSFFHAPILWLTIWGIGILFLHKKDIVNGMGIGTIIHLALDLPLIPFLWPIIQYDFSFIENYMNNWLWTIIHDPIIIITEILSLIGLIYLIIKHRLFFNWNQTKDYLFRSLTPTKEL